MKYSFICCWNDPKQLQELLLDSYTKVYGQGEEKPMLLLIDNSARKYKSAAEAFNSEYEAHKQELDDILIFLHQDIAFDNSSFFDRIAQELLNDQQQIIGAAGINKNGSVFSNLKYKDNEKYIVKQQINAKQSVESIDECCFAMHKELFERVRFDASTCNHWHLYGVDFCYSAKKYGIPSYVIPEPLYHKHNDTGGLITDKHFLRTMWNLVRKHSKQHNRIYAPCYIIGTRIDKAIAKLAKTAIKNLVK